MDDEIDTGLDGLAEAATFHKDPKKMIAQKTVKALAKSIVAGAKVVPVCVALAGAPPALSQAPVRLPDVDQNVPNQGRQSAEPMRTLMAATTSTSISVSVVVNYENVGGKSSRNS